MSEQEIGDIIQRILKGEKEEFSLLVRQYQNLVFNICYKMMPNQAEAEDVAQEIFLKAFRNLRQFKGKSKFSTWLYSIAYYACINALRKLNREEQRDLDAELTEQPPNASVFEDIHQADKEKYVAMALDTLSAHERGIVLLYYFESQTVEEIAEITGLSKSLVKVRLHRCRKKIGEALEGVLQKELPLFLTQ